MSRITVTVFKHGLALEAELNKIARGIERKEDMEHRFAVVEAEKRLDPVAYTQVTHSESKELDLQTLGQHIAKGAPFSIERAA
jgi:hypothetical protein